MSELAPFVAAVLHDKVVMEQMEEISVLKRKLHERDPYRSVQLQLPSSATENSEKLVITEKKTHLGNFLGPNKGKSTELFSTNSGCIRDQEFTLKRLQQLELWIDGGRAVCIGDLEFYYLSYVFRTNVPELGKYKVLLAGKLGDDFKILFLVCDVPPEAHAELLNRKTPVDFPPPDDPKSTNSDLPGLQVSDTDFIWPIDGCDNGVEGQKVSKDRLNEVLQEKPVCLYFQDIQCTWAFLKEKLRVPFDSQNLIAASL